MQTYAGLTKAYYVESLRGFQNQHSVSLLKDSWITPRDILERIIKEQEYILDSWEDISVDDAEDLTTEINR